MRGGKTVLIVGGEEEARISLAESLMAARYRVLEAEGSKEGDALVRSHRPDLTVLMDGELPDDHATVIQAEPSAMETTRAVQERIGAAFPAPPRARRRPRIRLPRKPART